MKRRLLAILLSLTAVSVIAQSTEQQWTIKAPSPTPRRYHGSALVDSVIYVIGGFNTTSAVNTVQAYSPLTNMWTTIESPMPTARGEVGVAAVNGKVYAIGGFNGSSAVGTVEEYDPATSTWSTKAAMPTPRSILSVGVLGNNIYAIGGWPGVYATVEAYNTVTNTWSAKASLPVGLKELNGCAVVNGKLHLIGGLSSAVLSSNYVYDTTTDSWSADMDMPFARYEGAATVLNNEIYYMGGTTSPTYTTYLPNYKDNLSFNPVTHTWQSRLSMIYSRVGFTATTFNGKIYVIGGYDSAMNAVDWTHEYTINYGPSFTHGHSQPLTVCDTDDELSIFPNPATNAFTIKVSQPWQEAEIIITDVTGKLVYKTESRNDTKAVINLDVKGTYLVKVITRDKIYRDRIVIW